MIISREIVHDYIQNAGTHSFLNVLNVTMSCIYSQRLKVNKKDSSTLFLRHYEKRKIGKYLTTGNYGRNKYAIMACYHNMESYKQMHVYIQLEIARWQLA